MSRSLGTALFAVLLAGSSLGTAQAKTHPGLPVVASALENAASRHAAGPESTDAAPTAPTASASELRSGETASTMPSANADLDMWSSPVAISEPQPHPSLSVHTARTDTMRRFARGIVSRTSSIAMSLTRSAMRFIGTPYVFGGTSVTGFDCSGYTQHVFAMLGIALPRTADAQFYAGRATSGGMATGDLVFFQTYEPGPSHVGIYLGEGRFVHSSSHGVMVSRLGDSYWHERYIGAKRLANFN